MKNSNKVKRSDLEKFLNKLLNIYDYQDYGPNGLQIQGKEQISKIAFAVSATKESIEKAVAIEADALIVHHGLFWKFHGPKTLTGAFYKRVAPLIKNDINLFGYHLPLDAHLEVGNARAIADKIGLSKLKPFGDHKGMPTGVQGKLETDLLPSQLIQVIEEKLNHSVMHSCPDEKQKIKSIGIITGGANNDWILAKRAGLDAYITGEMSEHDWHEAKESGIHFFAAGHNATEQFGVQYLLKKINEQFSGPELFYLPSHNPA